MHRSSGFTARLVLSCALSGLGLACGGGREAPSVALELGTGALTGDAARFGLFFHDPLRSCADLTDSAARPVPVAGPFDIDASPRGATYRLDEISVGEYVVWVDALDAQSAVIGTGCASGQRIYEGALSRIRIRISSSP